MTKSQIEAYLARIKYTPPAKPESDVERLKKMMGIK
jgi:hypothetical protein